MAIRAVSLLLPLLTGATTPTAQEEVLHPGEELRFDLGSDDEALVEGRGPTRLFLFEATETVEAFFAVQSTFEPYLRIESEDGHVLFEQDDAGREAAFGRLRLAAGKVVFAFVGAKQPDGSGQAWIRLQTLPSREPEDAAIREVRRRLGEPDLLWSRGEWEAAYASCRELLRMLDGVEGGERIPAAIELYHSLAQKANNIALYDEAEEAVSKVISFYETVMPRRHRDLWIYRGLLGIVLANQERYDEARRIHEAALGVLADILPETSNFRLLAQANLADAYFKLFDYRKASELQAEVVRIRSAFQGERNPDLLFDRIQLAAFQTSLGDFGAARIHLEDVLALIEGDRGALATNARSNLARLLRLLGDARGALSLYEELIFQMEETYPEGHRHLQEVRNGFGLALSLNDQHEEALDFFQLIVETWEGSETLRLQALNNLSWAYRHLGDEQRAFEIRQDVVASLDRLGFSQDQWYGVAYRNNYCISLRDVGRAEDAVPILRDLLSSHTEVLSEAAYSILATRANLAMALFEAGDHDGAREEVDRLIDGVIQYSVKGLGLGLAPREMRERTAHVSRFASEALAVLGQIEHSPSLAARAFKMAETLRAIDAGEGRVPVRAWDDDAKRLRYDVLVARRAVHALQQTLRQQPDEDLQRELGRAIRSRDRAEAALSRSVGATDFELGLKSVAAALPPESASVGFLRYKPEKGEPRLLAHVAHQSGELERVEIGTEKAIREAVQTWRASIGTTAGRGERVALGKKKTLDPVAAGARLRELVLDPILVHVDAVDELFVCLDGPLHVVPIDALPLKEGVVGDRYTIHTEISFARICGEDTDSTPSSSGSPTLVAIGGVNFNADASATVEAVEAFAPIRSVGRSSLGRFEALPGSAAEVEAVSSMFAEAYEGDGVLLQGSDATKHAFFENAPKARFLHLATHGYFSGTAGGELSFADMPGFEIGNFAEVRGMAPLTYCGLALAGANATSGPSTQGILTGEELAAIDLSGCELATLSACESNVGARDSGRSVLSLQAALRSSGARSALTSLWKVPDEDTRVLMTEFYRLLWKEGLSKSRALWGAKRHLRERGAPILHWAGWVLTGDPN